MKPSRNMVLAMAYTLEEIAKSEEPNLRVTLKNAAEMLRDLAPRATDFKPTRCKMAKVFDGEGGSIATRCKKPISGHGSTHLGRGLDQFPMYEFSWQKGDLAEFETDRDDFYGWVVTEKGGEEDGEGADRAHPTQ